MILTPDSVTSIDHTNVSHTILELLDSPELLDSLGSLGLPELLELLELPEADKRFARARVIALLPP
jgi:hypothetical protein